MPVDALDFEALITALGLEVKACPSLPCGCAHAYHDADGVRVACLAHAEPMRIVADVVREGRQLRQGLNEAWGLFVWLEVAGVAALTDREREVRAAIAKAVWPGVSVEDALARSVNHFQAMMGATTSMRLVDLAV